LLVTLPAPSLPAQRRSALIISTGTYQDPDLPDLRGPAQDAADLSAVLRDPEYGGFDVSELLDKNKTEIEEALDDFLGRSLLEETVLVYFSCHGLESKWGDFYLAAANTRINAISSTALEGRWLTNRLNQCRARRQVVIVDSCFSGAFIGAKGDAAASLRGWLNDSEMSRTSREGRGRAVLTASRATERSFEDDGTRGGGTPVRSVFSRALVEGLRTGDADGDRDGLISVIEAYDYASRQVEVSDQRQTPQLMYHGEGRVFLVRSRRGRFADPALLLNDPRPAVRVAALESMTGWLNGLDPGKVQAARNALEQANSEDIAQMNQVARERLAGQTVPGTSPALTSPATRAAAKTGLPPRAGRPRHRWSRLAAVMALVIISALITVIAIKIDLSGRTSPPSCPTTTGPGYHEVTTLGGSAGAKLTFCPVQVDHGHKPGLNINLAGRITGTVPPGQVLAAVSQPDPGSCDTDHLKGSGGYYLLGVLHPSASHGDFRVTSPDYYAGAQSIQRHIFFVLGPQSAVVSFGESRKAYGQAHGGVSDSWPGKATLAGFRLLGTFTFTPVQPADRYCTS
jgi:Caspase domain